MCGIFGVIIGENSNLPKDIVVKLIRQLYLESESRGKESAGLAIKTVSKTFLFKKAFSPSKMLNSSEYKKILDESLSLTTRKNDKFMNESFLFVGHARLVTNGDKILNYNNQPVSYNDISCVHNGIIVNSDALWKKNNELQRKTELDSEIIPALISKYKINSEMTDAVKNIYKYLEGSASTATWEQQGEDLILATNTGSLFYSYNSRCKIIFFASEKYIIDRIHKSIRFPKNAGNFELSQVLAGSGCTVNLKTCSINEFLLDKFDLHQRVSEMHPENISNNEGVLKKTTDRELKVEINNLRRCSKCVLPETVPYISFDVNGVCNFCNNHEKKGYLGLDKLMEDIEPFRSKNGEPDCIIGLSGGRDSSYGLHYAKKILGLNPIAYTYDWGMVTDIARRNQARICGELGIEHIIVSADIKKKRKYIKDNINAWLRKPSLGMIPLFMAGDKHYFKYAHEIQKKTGIKLAFWLSNARFETCVFKSGFAGVNLGKRKVWDISIVEKLKFAMFYMKNFIQVPGYLNKSLWDTVVSFYWSWFKSHNFVYLFDYIEWNEDEINSTLQNEYGWETDKGSKSTWRIGDGTSAFYNYIYYKAAGLTEHDAFRSNQIREGVLNRKDALELLKYENLPRYDSLEWYAETIGFNLQETYSVIEKMSIK